MDDRTRVPEIGDGRVRFTGGTSSGEFPHVCPYRPNGADRDFCAETTANIQRNKGGCCGTSDGRNFAPCNSLLRKCIACLLAGDGRKNKPVVDLKRGFCSDHVEAADNPLPPRVRAPQPIVRRTAVEVVDVVVSRPRPIFPRAPVQEMELPKAEPAVIERHVRQYEPPSKPASVETEREPPPEPEDRQPLLTPEQIEEMAKKIPRLSPREKEACKELVTQGYPEVSKKMGVGEAGLKGYVSTACSRLGIPRSNRHKPYDRLGAIRLVMARYAELKAESYFEKPSTLAPVEGTSSLDPHELRVLELFRSMGVEKRLIALRVLSAIKSE